MPTPDPTGAWLSLDARFLKRQKRTIGWIYAAALRSALATRLGLTWGPVTEGHGDIVGVPASLITEFSQRSEQVEAALAERLGAWVDAHDGDRALVLMAAFTGLRRGELFGLTRRRLDLLHRAVTVTEQRQQLRNGTLIVGPPKTDAGRRTVALPGPLIPEIEAHLATYGPPDADGLVFTGPKGGPLRDHVWADQVGQGPGRARIGRPPFPRSSPCRQHTHGSPRERAPAS